MIIALIQHHHLDCITNAIFLCHSFTLNDFHVVIVLHHYTLSLSLSFVDGVVVVRCRCHRCVRFNELNRTHSMPRCTQFFFSLTIIFHTLIRYYGSVKSSLIFLCYFCCLLLLLMMRLLLNYYRITMCFSDLIHFHSEINASIY